MNINKSLQSYRIIFPKDCSLQNLKQLTHLGSIPVFESYNPDLEQWFVDYSTLYNSFYMRPTKSMNSTILKLFLMESEDLLKIDWHYTEDLVHEIINRVRTDCQYLSKDEC